MPETRAAMLYNPFSNYADGDLEACTSSSPIPLRCAAWATVGPTPG